VQRRAEPGRAGKMKLLDGPRSSRCSSLFAIRPTGHLVFFATVGDARFRTVAEIEGDEGLAHVQLVRRGFTFVGDLDVLGLAVHGDDLLLGHADFGIFLGGLLSGAAAGAFLFVTGATGSEESAGREHQNRAFHRFRFWPAHTIYETAS